MYRIALIANRSHRSGPDSRLVRFVREFEHFLEDQTLFATTGSAYAIKRAGLLQRGHINVLPTGKEGALVRVTHMVVLDKLDVVIYLMDPVDPTSGYPEALALKRECVAKKKFFLSTYMSAVEWASLNWESGGDRIVTSEARGKDDLSTQQIALIAHDKLKVEMLKFALLSHYEFMNKFNAITATGTTGKYLNGDRKLSILLDELLREMEVAEREARSREIERLNQQINILKEIMKNDKFLKVNPKQSGPDGGDVEIAYDVLRETVHKVIFFEDPYAARPHEPDIQLLERSCRVLGETVVCLSDPTSADGWASAWRRGDQYLDRLPVTVVRALENKYRCENLLRVVIAPTNDKDPDLTTQNICEAAAWYISSLIERLRLDGLPNDPVKIAVPWGSTMGSVVLELAKIEKEVNNFPTKRVDKALRQNRVQVCSMTGLIGSDEPSVEANVIAERFSNLFETGEHISIPGVAFVNKHSELSKQIKEATANLRDVDIALLVGAPVRDPFGVEAKAPVWPSIVEDARKRGAVGEVNGIFVDQNGKEISLARHQRVGINFDDMRQITQGRNGRVILLIGSRREYLPLAKSLLCRNMMQGFISTIVTDLQFGRWLLDLDGQPR